MLRQGKHTYEVWKRLRHVKQLRWQNLMARRLPGGKPFVLLDSGNGGEGATVFESTTWIQATLGGVVSYYTDGYSWEPGQGRPFPHVDYGVRGPKGTPTESQLLPKETVRRAKKVWQAYLRHKDTRLEVRHGTCVDDRIVGNWKGFRSGASLTLRYPAPPSENWGLSYANRRFASDAVKPSLPRFPGLFVQTFLLSCLRVNRGFIPFAMRLPTVPPLLKHHVPRPGTARVFAPDGCASVDLQTNEVVSPEGHRRKLPGVSKIIGVTWLPGKDPFRVSQLRAAEIEAALSVRRARLFERKKQYRQAAENYLHGGRLLIVVGARYSAAAKLFRRALSLRFKHKKLRVKLHSELGWALFSAGQLDQATRVLRAGLSLRPSLRLKGALLYNLGRIAEKRGKLPLAKRLYRDSVMVWASRTAINRLRRVMRQLRKQDKQKTPSKK